MKFHTGHTFRRCPYRGKDVLEIDRSVRQRQKRTDPAMDGSAKTRRERREGRRQIAEQLALDE